MAFRSITSASSNVNVTSLVVTAPSGLATNDGVVATATQGTADVMNPPTGFTELASSEIQNTTHGATMCAGWKIEASPPANYTFTIATADACASIVAFSGIDATGTLNQSSGAEDETDSASPRNINATGFTTTEICDLVWIGTCPWDAVGSGKSFTPPTNFTERLDLDSGDETTLGIATRDAFAVGATGTVTGTSTFAGHSGGFITFMLALKNAAASGSAAKSTGASTTVARGSSSASSIPRAAGSSTAVARGESSATALATSEGNGTSAGIGASAASAVMSSTGASAATAVGESIADSSAAMSSDGVSTASAIGESQSSGVAASTGSSTANAVGTSVTDGSGAMSSSGTSTATAVGASTGGTVKKFGPRGRAIAAKTKKLKVTKQKPALNDEADLEVIKLAFSAALTEFYKIAA